MKLKYLISSIGILLCCMQGYTQTGKVIDEIIGTVGDEIILLSDVETQYVQYLAQGNYANEQIKCFILDQLLLDKLLLHQARIDSISVTEPEVISELDRRMAYFIAQIGSEEKLEEYYDKTILELKDEFKSLIQEQMLIQRMQGKITGDLTVTPAEVRSYFSGIPEDSLPLVNTEIEYAQIVMNVGVSEAQKQAALERMQGFKKRLDEGENFSTLAVLYSDDLSSAKNGGDIGFTSRGDLVPEYEAAAFSLQPNEISEIIESKFGFHIIQLIERRGEQINTRHILVKPKVTADDQQLIILKLDSIKKKINAGIISFDKAAVKYSDDEDTKLNGGKSVNPVTANSKFETDQLDPTIFFQIDKLAVGEISEPVLIPTPTGDPSYRLLKLISRSEPHKANLVEDYQRIQEAALNDKRNKTMQEWVQSKRRSTFINIKDDYKQCSRLEYWFN